MSKEFPPPPLAPEEPYDLEAEHPELFDLEYISQLVEARIESHTVIHCSKNNDGTLEKYLIKYHSENADFYATTNTNYQMQPSFKNQQALHAQMPDQTIPRPITFLKDNSTVIYQELVGENFADFLQHKPEAEQLKCFQKAGMLLKQLHQVDMASMNTATNTSNTSLENIMSSINHNAFAEIEEVEPEFSHRLKALYEKIIAYEAGILAEAELVATHGDFHPKNLIIKKDNNAGMVDFTEVSVSVKGRDIGGFLEQTYAILKHQGLANEDLIEHFQASFLEGYGDNIKPDDTEVRFYQSWQAWRNAMYNAVMRPPVMEDAEEFLTRAEEHFANVSQ